MVTGTGITEALAGATSDALKAAGFTRRTAAETSGIPITTLQRRLTGRTPLNTEQLERLAMMAGTTVSALVSEAERRANSPAGDGTPDLATSDAKAQVGTGSRSLGSAERPTRSARRSA